MAATEPPTRLEVRDATVRFGGITALDRVSLDVDSGEVVGVIGPNGAGKTTLFNLICGFVKPESGSLHWRGRSLAGVHPSRLAAFGVARTLQGVGLFERLTVLENVMAGAERFRRVRLISTVLSLSTPYDRARVALERVGCEQVAGRLPGTLPYAVQKRVALARALASDPELLLLDEPAGGLDAGELSELADLIGSLGSGIAVMVVDHHMDLVTSVCNRMVVLDFGRVIASGSPSDVRRDQQVLDAYLGREVEGAGATRAIGHGDARP